MHAGAGAGEAANKGGLFANRSDRRLCEIVYLPGQQPGNAAGEEQCEIGRRIVGLGSGLPKGRNIYECCGCIERAEAVDVVFQGAKISGSALADDEVGPR